MKKIKFLVTIFALILLLSLISAYGVCAKESKSNIIYKLDKQGTLVIKGSGKMPKNMVFKNNKKIKKVVIKRGVTSISDVAFYRCKKLKKVILPDSLKSVGALSFSKTSIKKITIPKSVKKIGQGCFNFCSKLKYITMPGRFQCKRWDDGEALLLMYRTNVKTITFNTNLKLKVLPHLNSYNLVTKKGDKRYKSFDGIVYSKKGKDLVRVPTNRKTLKVKRGCKTFCLSAIAYYMLMGGDPVGGCTKLKAIELPDTIKQVETEKYALQNVYWEYMPGNGDYIPVQTIKVDNKKLHGKYIAILTNAYHDLDVEKFVSQFGQRISEVNHLICTDDHVVIRYKGNGVQLYIQNKNDKIFNPAAIEDKVIVPEGIKVIGERAFITEYEVREIQLPASLEEIGDYAFFELNELKNLVIPKNVKKIGKKTIY